MIRYNDLCKGVIAAHDDVTTALSNDAKAKAF